MVKEKSKLFALNKTFLSITRTMQPPLMPLPPCLPTTISMLPPPCIITAVASLDGVWSYSPLPPFSLGRADCDTSILQVRTPVYKGHVLVRPGTDGAWIGSWSLGCNNCSRTADCDTSILQVSILVYEGLVLLRLGMVWVLDWILKPWL